MNADLWRDVALMRHGPWTFEIIGLYVFLDYRRAPVPHRLPPYRLATAAGGQLDGVHVFLQDVAAQRDTGRVRSGVSDPGLAAAVRSRHGDWLLPRRDRCLGGAMASRCTASAAVVAGAFMLFALCNPRADGPSWLRSGLVPPELFTHVYDRYFALSELGVGRLLNLAIALPLGYALLTVCWPIARASRAVFVTLGEQSLGAFALHVYGLILLANLPRPDAVWANTAAPVLLILAIAWALNLMKRLRLTQKPARQLAPVRAWATSS